VSGPTTHSRKSMFFTVLAAFVVVTAVCLTRSALRGQRTNSPTERDAISITADMSHEFSEGLNQISVLRGRCRILQGGSVLSAQKMVVWHRQESSAWGDRDRLSVYLEGDVRIDRPGRSVSESFMVINLLTRTGVSTDVRSRSTVGSATRDDPLFLRARRRLARHRRGATARGTLQRTQLVLPGDDAGEPELRSVQIQAPPGNLRRVRISPRSAVPYQLQSFLSKETIPPERVWVLTGGVNVLIDGVDGYGTIDLSADRMVIWTRPGNSQQLRTETLQTRDTPFQVYMEGNVVIRQGGDPLQIGPQAPPRIQRGGDFTSEDADALLEQQRRGNLEEIVLRATHATYDAKEERALLINAELKTFVPQLKGDLRLRARRILQRAQNSFHLQDAWISSSQFAKPGYRLQSTDIFYEPRIVNPWVGPRGPAIDPVTGEPIEGVTPWITSLNNTFFVEDVPLFYTPYLAAPAEKPNIPLRRATLGHDRIMGAQVETVWNMFTLLGLEEPDDARWDFYADYFSQRGPAFGTGAKYFGAEMFGVPGTYVGEGLAYGILDSGEDNLGFARLALPPENEARGRIFIRHRHNLPLATTLIAEIGLLSDRNFLEQYYEGEFDKKKDNETLLYVKQQFDNLAWTALLRPQVNDFENTTEWLPRGDIYLLSEPFWNGLLTWSTHTSAAYGNLKPAQAPSDPVADRFDPLPFVDDVGGAVLMSRHELTMPLHAGPVNVVPYLLGEAAFWGEDLTGQSIDRFVGGGGVRSSVMAWRTYPFVESRILNLNGLAHKIRLEGEYAWTNSTRDLLTEVPQYNEFDDNAQERFRQRFPMNTFGGMVPAVFEPRVYAVRTGAGRSVTAPYHELVDDQQVLRLALRQRLQTKVGPPERLRIKDWMRFDLEASVFPNPDRDNFDDDVGLLGGQYRWNFGDRTSLEASAYYDLFEAGQKLWSIALLTQRPPRGSLYLGLRQVKGFGLDSQILNFSFSYTMSPKWVSTFYTAYDIGEERNLGQSAIITRVGSDFLIHFGINYDESKDNAGIALSIEPRFSPFVNSSPNRLGALLNGTADQQR